MIAWKRVVDESPRQDFRVDYLQLQSKSSDDESLEVAYRPFECFQLLAQPWWFLLTP